MSKVEQYPGMTVLRDGDVVRVEFDSPTTRNALGGDALDALNRVIDEVPACGLLILIGAGGAFTSGGDRRELAPLGSEAEQAAVLRTRASLVEKIRSLDAVSIAAIDGACVGLGVGLAAACTLRLVSDRAFVDTAYLRLGLSGDFGCAHLLSELIGRGAAADWLLRPRRIPAAELVATGFAQTLWSTDAFDAEVQETVRTLAAHSSVARQGITANIRDAARLDLSRALDAESRRHVHAKIHPSVHTAH